jgi:NTE family protein
MATAAGRAPFAVVFSGGGALGAWEVGCLATLVSHHGGYPGVVAGSSAGAMNAAGVAAGFDLAEMQALWSGLTRRRVYRRRPRERGWLSLAGAAAWNSLTRRSLGAGLATTAAGLTSVFDSSPLAATLRDIMQPRFASFQQFAGAVAIAVTDLHTNASKYFYQLPAPAAARPANWKQLAADPAWQAISSFEVLLSALIASSAIPVLFPPHGHYVDGGVMRNQPVAAAARLTAPGVPIYVLIPAPETLAGAITLRNVSGRLLDAWMGAGITVDLTTVGIRNTADRALGAPQTPVCVMRASRDLTLMGSGLLAFGRAVPDLCACGAADATLALARFDAADPATWARGSQSRY